MHARQARFAVQGGGYPSTPFAHKCAGNFKKPTKIVIARTITYIFVTGIDKLKTSPTFVSIGEILMTCFVFNSSRFSSRNALGHLPSRRRILMKKLAPAATPGFAFHAAPANAFNLVDPPCLNTPAASKVRMVSAAYSY